MRLVSVDEVRPSTYNPREADEERLALVELSLRKLGYLMPIYADPSGEIVSGHQRHHVTVERMGLTHLPVSYIPEMSLGQRKAINIVFNRATNDMEIHDRPDSMKKELMRRDVWDLGEALPDRTGHDLYPCLNAEEVELKKFVKPNRRRWSQYARNVASTLQRRKIEMPIIATHDYRVVNGIGRVQLFMEQSREAAAVVFISEEEAEFADAMLNLLTMDFDIHRRYADILRHNSFRRARGRRSSVGYGMVWPLGLKMREFDVHNPQHLRVWKRKFGEPVLDFGGGQLEDSTHLRNNGVDVDVFEPYPLRGDGIEERSDDIDKEKALRICRDFLDAVAAGKQWVSIFMSAVLNSVPFDQDRHYVLGIVAALCGPFTTFYTYTNAVGGQLFKTLKGERRALNHQSGGSIQFLLTYEENVSIGEFGKLPKVQKYFKKGEVKALLDRHFRRVKEKHEHQFILAAARNPRPIDREFLRRAIEFEFDLPYPDGTRMGMVDEALAAFSKRLGVEL